jgi:purine-nucleoside phosphorylase
MSSNTAPASEFDRIDEAAAAVRQCFATPPVIGIILGTGLGGLADEIENPVFIHYQEIPHFPHSTAPSHKGRLVCGTLGGKPVVAMQGRFHIYENYKARDIAFPVRVMKALGCGTLIVSNAGGGLNPQYAKGDLMLIEDHINLLGDNPLIGPNDDRLGVRFPDMCHAYTRELLDLAKSIALRERIPVQKGVYVAVSGPNLETAAEYRFLRTIGADIVGMSTVPEVIVAVHGGMRVLGVSVVTDMCLADALKPVSLDEIVEVANDAEKRLRKLIKAVITEL